MSPQTPIPFFIIYLLHYVEFIDESVYVTINDCFSVQFYQYLPNLDLNFVQTFVFVLFPSRSFCSYFKLCTH